MESANTFDDVRDILKQPIQKGVEITHGDIEKLPIAARPTGKEGERVEGVGEGGQTRNEPTGSVRDIVPGTRVPDTGLVEQPGYSKDIVGDIVREGRGQGRTGIPPEVTRGEGVRPEELPGQLPLSSKQPRLADATIQVPYIPKSKGKSGENVIPKNLADAIAKVLQKTEDTYGDVDPFRNVILCLT